MRRRTVLCLAFLIAGCSDDRITPPSTGLAPTASDARPNVVMAWTTLATNLSAPRFLPGVTTGPDGRVYAFGGQVGLLSTQATAEVYDAPTDTWSFIAPMPRRRANQAAVLGSDGRIYNVAGLVIVPPSTGNVSTTSVDVYNPVTNTWAPGPSLPGVARQNVSGTAGLDGRVYVAGGNTPTMSTAAFVLDPGTGVWTTIAPMLTPRSSFAMATGPSGRIYAIGGNITGVPTLTSTSAVEAYDPATNTWSAVAPLPGTRGLHSAATGADGRIYVFGGTANGFQSPPFLTDAFAYDEATNTWSPVPAPTVGRVAGRGALGGDGRIYFVGGAIGSATAAPPTEAFGPVCNQSPVISMTVAPTELWPPNHNMIPVATGISATDDCGTPSLTVAVGSNEPVNGPGDGNTSSDWLVTTNGDGTFNVAVRSERSGTAGGRLYTITATATDGDGNVTVATGTVAVAKHK